MADDFITERVLGDIEGVRRWLQQRHQVMLPETAVLSSENITHALSLLPIEIPKDACSGTEERYRKDIDHNLKQHGLTRDELHRVSLPKFTIFLPRRDIIQPAQFCEDIWHEMAHAAAYALDLKDKQYIESFAVTYSFIGLLQGVKVGKFSPNEVFDQIEFVIKNVHLSFPLLPHRWSLKFVEKYVSHLEFRGRDPDELLDSLNKTIGDIVDTDREVSRIVKDRKLTAFERPRIILLAAAAAALMIVALVLSLLHRI